MFHKLKVKPKDGGISIFLDKKELHGVQGLELNMGVDSIPTLYLEMNVTLSDIEVDKVQVECKEK